MESGSSWSWCILFGINVFALIHHPVGDLDFLHAAGSWILAFTLGLLTVSWAEDGLIFRGEHPRWRLPSHCLLHPTSQYPSGVGFPHSSLFLNLLSPPLLLRSLVHLCLSKGDTGCLGVSLLAGALWTLVSFFWPPAGESSLGKLYMQRVYTSLWTEEPSRALYRGSLLATER